MGIDVGSAHMRAGQLTQYVGWLESSKRKMQKYKSQINSNWSGVEVGGINIAIDQVIASINQAIGELNQISRDVVNTANAIRAEEIEAERRRRMQEAQTQVNRISNTLQKLKKQKKEIEKAIRSLNAPNPSLQRQLTDVNTQIRKSNNDYNSWVSKYNALKR